MQSRHSCERQPCSASRAVGARSSEKSMDVDALRTWLEVCLFETDRHLLVVSASSPHPPN
eukprot:758277-Hanusia_phi.AAC.1